MNTISNIRPVYFGNNFKDRVNDFSRTIGDTVQTNEDEVKAGALVGGATVGGGVAATRAAAAIKKGGALAKTGGKMVDATLIAVKTKKSTMTRFAGRITDIGETVVSKKGLKWLKPIFNTVKGPLKKVFGVVGAGAAVALCGVELLSAVGTTIKLGKNVTNN